MGSRFGRGDFKRRVHHRIRVARFPAEKQVVIILFYVPPIGGVISGLNREEKFLPVFVRFDVEAPIGAPKIVATVPVLGEAFAHDSFAKSTKLARPSVLAHDITPLEVQGAGVAYPRTNNSGTKSEIGRPRSEEKNNMSDLRIDPFGAH